MVIFFLLIAYLTSIVRGSRIGRKHRKARLEPFQGWWIFLMPWNPAIAVRAIKACIWQIALKKPSTKYFYYFLFLTSAPDCIWPTHDAAKKITRSFTKKLFCLVKIMALLKWNSTTQERKEVRFFELHFRHIWCFHWTCFICFSSNFQCRSQFHSRALIICFR